jgi:hypothetical protein
MTTSSLDPTIVPAMFPTTSETNDSTFDPIFFDEGIGSHAMNWSWWSSSMSDSLNWTPQFPAQFPNPASASTSASTTNPFQFGHPSFAHNGQ